MFTEKTVFVLGAGASASFGFPTGKKLKDDVAWDILREREVFKRLTTLQHPPEELKRFARALDGSGQSSIDAFIERRGDFLEIGKAAIAAALLPYEKRQRHSIDWVERRRVARERGDETFEDNWYDLLFNMFTDRAVECQDLGENQLGIITFNYDRSLEDYLVGALQNSYGISHKEAATVMTVLPIEHMYGSLGALPWQGHIEGEYHEVPYTGKALVEHVAGAAKSITILPEGDQKPEAFSRGRKLLREAQYVYFLGFGYHPSNLARLGLADRTMQRLDPNRVAGTSLGLSAWAKEGIRKFRALGNLHQAMGNLFDETVYSFLHRHVAALGWK